MGLHVVEHPVLQEALAVLRDRATGPPEFRRALGRAAAVLFLEASRDLPQETGSVESPLGRAPARRLRSDAITLVPVLRAGQGMLDGILPLVPSARVAHVGLRRDEATAEAERYYANLPASVKGSVAFVLDPMLATGGTLAEALRLLAEAGVAQSRVLAVVAAPEGVARLQAVQPRAEIHVAAVDEGLDGRKYILPGLGDAGDRCWGTI